MVEKITKKFGLFMVALSLLAGCNWSGSKEDKATAASSKILVVNVLDASLYNDAHIAGSINVPLADLQNAAQKWDKEVPVVIYCSNYTCSASAGGARILQGLGFKNVSAYEGGMAQWYQLSREDNTYGVEGPTKEDYLSVKVTPPSHEAAQDVKIITAQELREQLRSDKNL